jgi:hypothetical protein
VLLALPWLFRSLHTHFIKLQPSHTLEHVPFLVLAKQQWNVSEDCRLLEPTFRLGLPQLLRKELA